MENEWDQVAEEYSQIIGNLGDIWRQVDINPAILSVLSSLPTGKILDLGCGEGYLERLLIPMGWEMTGVDSSKELLQRAKSKNSPGRFILGDITNSLPLESDFNVVIANMVLMDITNLNGFYQYVYNYLKPNGLLLVTVTHPVLRKPTGYWAKTITGKILGHDPFWRIDDYTTVGPRQNLITNTTHPITVWHKTISDYIQSAIDKGFKLTTIKELAPSRSDLAKYNQPKFLAKFPHTLFLVFVKNE